MRQFETGATRDTEEGKLDYEGFLSPYALTAFAKYMDDNRVQADGSVRDSDNWQKGIPSDVYMKSMFRHFMEVWSLHRKPRTGIDYSPEMTKALCALLFNVQGYLHELNTPMSHNIVSQRFEIETRKDSDEYFLKVQPQKMYESIDCETGR